MFRASMKTYAVTPYCIAETVLIRGHNIHFTGKYKKINLKLIMLPFLARQEKSRKSYCTTPGVGVGIGVASALAAASALAKF